MKEKGRKGNAGHEEKKRGQRLGALETGGGGREGTRSGAGAWVGDSLGLAVRIILLSPDAMMWCFSYLLDAEACNRGHSFQ